MQHLMGHNTHDAGQKNGGAVLYAQRHHYIHIAPLRSTAITSSNLRVLFLHP
jgi:hypothetical protein